MEGLGCCTGCLYVCVEGLGCTQCVWRVWGVHGGCMCVVVLGCTGWVYLCSGFGVYRVGVCVYGGFGVYTLGGGGGVCAMYACVCVYVCVCVCVVTLIVVCRKS